MTPATHLVFSLGPVQGLIAQSRRTADGWVGSYLLSYIMGAVILKAEKEGLSIQEPGTRGLPMLDAMRGMRTTGDTRVAAIPNVAVMQIGGFSPADVARTLDQEARRVWLEDIVKPVESCVFPRLDDARPIWDAQVATCWEISVGWGGGSAAAYRSLSARKGVRDFTQTEAAGDRCTVCAEREALWPGEGRPVREAARKAWTDWSAALVSAGMPGTLFGPDGGERLCAICLIRRLLPWIESPLKRLWQEGHADGAGAFPSTSTMTTARYRADLLDSALQSADERLKQSLTRYAETLRRSKGPSRRGLDARVNEPGTFARWHDLARRQGEWAELGDLLAVDGDAWLYGEAVRNEHQFSDATHRHLSDSYYEVMAAASAHGLAGPPIYYALLAMDGDRLGLFKENVERDGGDTGAISACLSEFAYAVPGIVEARNGRVIFAGGDDVLAMLPLVDALPAAESLRKSFRETFAAASSRWNSAAPPPTLSGAIVFAHHQAPLGRVIASAQAALKQWAKGRAGRNAVACQKFQRNGPSWTCAASWDVAGEPFVSRLLGFVERLKSYDVASGLAHTLEQYGWLLEQGGPLAAAHRRQFTAAILEKSRLLPQAEGVRRAAGLTLADEVIDLCDATSAAAGTRLDTSVLLLARFLSSEGREER